MTLFDAEKVESIMTVSLVEFADSWSGRCVLLHTALPEHRARFHMFTREEGVFPVSFSCLFRYWMYAAPQRNLEIHKEEYYF